MIMLEEFQDFLKYFEKTPKVVSNPRETIRLGWKDAKFGQAQSAYLQYCIQI